MVITLGGQKGGSGKTTTAMAIAGELVARGRRVLLVDGDPQGTVRTWAHKAAQKGHAGPETVAMGARELASDVLASILAKFEITIIDCPGWSEVTDTGEKVQRAALMSSDLAILPCGPQAVEGWALAASIKLVKEAMTARPGLHGFILMTRKRRTLLGLSAREALEGCGLPLLDSELGYRDSYEAAPGIGLGAGQYDPSDPAADEVRTLVDELLLRGDNRYGQTKTVRRRSRPHATAAHERRRRTAT